jgi:disulfide oxidoreductase YuzD
MKLICANCFNVGTPKTMKQSLEAIAKHEGKAP